jgi:hypothetical protein
MDLDGDSVPIKFLKAFVAFLILVALFSVLQRSLPAPVWELSFIATVTYGISLLFNENIPFLRRFALAYLVFAGASYLLAGIAGLLPNFDLIEGAMWISLISPFPLLILVEQYTHAFPHVPSTIPYDIFPPTNQPHVFFSIAVIIVSLSAIAAAFLMAKENKTSYKIWLVLVAGSLAEAFAYVLADSANWGMTYAGGDGSRASVVPLCWAASYLLAYLLVRIQRTPVTQIDSPS